MNIPKTLPFKGDNGPHFREVGGRSVCVRCGKPMTGDPVLLELCTLDNEFYLPGTIPSGWPSQGCFEYGRDCATMLLRRRIKDRYIMTYQTRYARDGETWVENIEPDEIEEKKAWAKKNRLSVVFMRQELVLRDHTEEDEDRGVKSYGGIVPSTRGIEIDRYDHPAPSAPLVPRIKVPFKFNDGGRAAAGYKGITGDCVVRAIAIAAQVPYQEVYDALFDQRATYAATRRNRTAANIRRKGNSPRNGSPRKVYDAYLKQLGWRFVPTMSFGSGCKVHLRPDELPGGRIIARVSKHLCAVIDGVIHDTYDCSRDGTRCVYGYYTMNATSKS